MSRSRKSREWGLATVVKTRVGWLLAGGVLSAGMVFLATAFITYILPREYLGKVRLEVHEDRANDADHKENLPSERFVQTQMRIITSKETLYPVIGQLQLMQKWDNVGTPSEAYLFLQRLIETELVSGTSLIDINVYYTDPQQAADIANAVAVAYRDRRNQIDARGTHSSVVGTDSPISLQAQKVERARMAMVEVLQKNRIVDLGGGYPVDGMQIAIRDKESQQQAESEIAKLATQVATLKKLNGPGLVEELIALKMIDADVMALLVDYNRIRVETEDRSISDAVDQDVASKLAGLTGILEKEGAAGLIALETRLAIARNSFESILKNLKNADWQPLGEDALRTQYGEAKRAFEKENLFLKGMEKFKREDNPVMTQRDLVTIHEIAEPSEIPARPDVRMELLFGVLKAALFAVPGGIVFAYLANLILPPK